MLAVVVGVATHPSSLAATGAAAFRPIAVVLQSVLWLGVAADVTLIAFFFYVLWPGARRKRPGLLPAAGGHLHWAVKLAALTAALLPLAIAIAILVHNRTAQLVGPSGVPRPVPVTASPASAPAAQAGDAVWPGLGLAASVLITLGLWLWFRRTRRSDAQVSRAGQAAKLSDALEETLEAMSSEPDPRKAVVAAYRLMESAFGRIGVPRRHFEAPYEYLARVLSSRPRTAGDAGELTHLFELARFSHHPIDEEMRSSAMASLSRIRDHLLKADAA